MPQFVPAAPPIGASATKWSPSGDRRYDHAALPTGMPRRVFWTVLGAAVLGILIAAPSALADAFTPESGGSPNADDIDTLYKITFYIGIVIFLLVWGVLIWSLVKYRARRGGTADQIRGNTPLEVGWTIGAAGILVVLTVVTFLYLDDIENPPPSGPNGLSANAGQFASVDQPNPPTSGGPTLTIRVNGQQYIWRYDYPGDEQLFSYNKMVVPTDTTVVLKIEASDVIHSWWIPKFGPKADAVPGYVNESWFKVPADRAGVYRGQCAELCGPNHADMRAIVHAMSPDDFLVWAEHKRAQIRVAGEALAEQREQREQEQQ
jgi:cytochrome c oxidase subunit II